MTLSPAEIHGMRHAVARTVFLHHATIMRRSATDAVDIDGHPITVWVTVARDVPCFLWHEDADLVSGDAINALVVRSRIKFRPDADVRVGDRIDHVRDERGIVEAQRIDPRCPGDLPEHEHRGMQVRERIPTKASLICELEAVR